MTNQYDWPLAQSHFTFLDRLKICSFFLKKDNRWTQDKYVYEYESKMAKFVNCEYAVFVSSGSAANQLICQKIKDDLIKSADWPKRNKVIVSAVTWQTNVSVWVREGFEPVFIDVNLDDFCLDYIQLDKYLKKSHSKVACVFPTAVLGFTPDVEKLRVICQTYEIPFKMDACENIFGTYKSESWGGEVYNVASKQTSSTSCFFAHQITTGTEGGFIFTNDYKEYIYYLMARAHGLRRNLNAYAEKLGSIEFVAGVISNSFVDSEFDFQLLSSNYRSSDIAAFCGLLDFERIDNYIYKRSDSYEFFERMLDSLRYYLPPKRENQTDIPFCLPIITRGEYKESRMNRVKDYLREKKIEFRGFISGNMLRQLPYQKYGDYKDFLNAEYLNNCAIYVGLNPKVETRQIVDLCLGLNNL